MIVRNDNFAPILNVFAQKKYKINIKKVTSQVLLCFLIQGALANLYYFIIANLFVLFFYYILRITIKAIAIRLSNEGSMISEQINN